MTPVCNFSVQTIVAILISILCIHIQKSAGNPVSLIYTSRELQEGTSVELECNVEGSLGRCTVHWLHNKRVVQQVPRNMIDEDSFAVSGGSYVASRLYISDVKPSDSGNYSCEVSCFSETQWHSDSKGYDLIVQPHSEGVQQADGSSLNRPVSLYLYTDALIAARGSNVLLLCRATQGPDKTAPTIEWSINGQTITDNPPPGLIKIHDNGDLELTLLDDWHLSHLRCTATGDDGSIDYHEPYIYVYVPYYNNNWE